MILNGDCLEKLSTLDNETIDLIYLDPPFFTNKVQRLNNYEYNDKWDSVEHYILYLRARLLECRRVLKATGSIFFHCDYRMNHFIRVLMDDVFQHFRSEIIWAYRRWTNSKRSLQNGHQTIYWYSKSNEFKFNRILCEYSPNTNVLQNMQMRERVDGKVRYKLDDSGNKVESRSKEGVPLSDVWYIPFLNPRSKERCGYPTQKPIILLDRIIRIASNEKDIILDPFCGSGTTLISAFLNNRGYIGIDISKSAIDVCKQRIKNPIKSNYKK